MAAQNPGPAEYAVLQLLFVNCEASFPSQPQYFAKVLQESKSISFSADLSEPPDLPSLVIPEPLFPSENDVPNTTANEVLVDIVGVPTQGELFKLALEATFSGARFSHTVQKLELPFLKSDPRHDLKALKETVAETRLHDFFCKPNTLPLEPVDDSQDEGLGIPASAAHFHDQLTRGAEPDELDYSEEHLLYVAESLYHDWADKDLEQLIHLAMDCTIERVQVMTPPLVALSPSAFAEERFVASAEICEIGCLSDPASLLSEDLGRVRTQLNEEYDGARLPDASTSDIINVSSDAPSLEILMPKHQHTELAMEVPILPSSDDEISGIQEEDACRALLRSVSDFHSGNQMGQQMETAVDEEDSGFDEQLNLLLTDKANDLARRLEQEHIEAVDAIARLQPPVVDFDIPAPDWQGAMQDPLTMFLWICRKHHDQFRSPQWPKNPREQKDLRWIPFRVSLAQTDVRESVGDDHILQQLFGGCGSTTAIPTSSDYVRKRRRLKLFSEDNDEELSPSCDTNPQHLNLHSPREGIMDIMDLIRKRRRTQAAEEGLSNLDSPTIGVKSRRLNNQMGVPKVLAEGLLLDEKEGNAAGKLLSNFMNLRAAKRIKSSTSSFLPKPATDNTAAAGLTMPRRAIQKAWNPQIPRTETQSVYSDAPSPPIKRLNEAPRVIISVALPRDIISTLQTGIPGIDLVDRDFTKHNTWSWSPGSMKRVEAHCSLSYEADIIPSPATGILITTVLKVRQKPLPGSRMQLSQIHQRVMTVAALYERIIVLVSEGNPTGEQAGPLNGADAEAYASFVAFASSLGSSGYSVRVIYVAGGSQTLANWTCALVATYTKEASSDVQQIIVSEETEWEVFLRRAGFNMYAAQVALAVVKGTFPEDGEDRMLVRFLGMSSAERANMLQQFLGGGRSLVDRVSARLG